MEIEELSKSYVVNVDLIKGIDFPSIKFTRNDNSNKIIFNITNNVKEVFLGNKTITVNIRKADNEKVIYGTKIINGQVIWELDLNAVACLGLVVVTVEIYEGDNRITSEKFSYNVSDEIGGIKVESTSELPVLTQLIADVNSTKVESTEMDSTLRETIKVADTVRLQLDKSVIDGKPLKGDKGEQGVSGTQGIQGIKGIQGLQGINGVKGDVGLTGETGQSGSGTGNMLMSIYDTNGDGKISYNDLSDQPTLLQGEKGLNGETGLQGADGIQGIAGKNGIEGVAGAKGETGLTGAQGLQGEKGTIDQSTLDTINSKISANTIKLTDYSSYGSVKVGDVYTIVDFKRSDATLYMNSTLSNADANGYFQTCVLKYYNSVGTTVVSTVIWTFTYDADGYFITKVVV